MPTKKYYSTRTGKNPNAQQWELPILLNLFAGLYRQFEEKGYFQEAFGYHCLDAGFVAGSLGQDIGFEMLRKLRKPDLWPISERCLSYSEDDLFDVIEFVHDFVSKPVDGDYHSWNDCGWHYHTFNPGAGKEEFRKDINELLRDYKDGFELSDSGEMLARPEQGLGTLLSADLPVFDPDNVENRVQSAIQKFRRYKSSAEDRRDAVRDLADVLEYLRPKLKDVLTKHDESDLFQIANKFGIRHHDESQKTDYDKSIWYSWMFYFYLATIHASVRLIQKQQPKSPS